MIIREQIKKRFEFDLNIGVFKSFLFRESLLIVFKIGSFTDAYLMIEILEDMKFECKTNRKPYESKVSLIDKICINVIHKEYGLYTSFEYYLIEKKYNYPPEYNRIPNYITF